MKLSDQLIFELFLYNLLTILNCNLNRYTYTEKYFYDYYYLITHYTSCRLCVKKYFSKDNMNNCETVKLSIQIYS